MNNVKLDTRSKTLRRLMLDGYTSVRRGHVASALSIVEILRVLYDNVLKYNPKNPRLKQRDRFILSKGHGSLALYAILIDKGFIPSSHLKNFCQNGALLGGHPDHDIPGVELSTGSLGHGLSVAVGLALNAKIDKTKYRTFVLIGDGECDEGSVWEAAMSASKHKLNNLTVIVDCNKMQSYGTTKEVQDLEPFVDKWKSFGFGVIEVNGHDVGNLKKVFSKLPLSEKKPSVIICHTIKGKGIKFIENDLSWHHRVRLTDEEVKNLYQGLEKY